VSEHLTRRQIEDYGRHKISVADLLLVSDHLEACEDCSRQVERALQCDATFFALRSGVFGEEAEPTSSAAPQNVDVGFPAQGSGISGEREMKSTSRYTPESTAGYVDETLPGEELKLMKDHLTVCDQCDMAVNDLQAFRERVAHDLDREYLPSPSLPRIWSRVFEFLPARFMRLPRIGPLFIGSGLAALLLILGSYIFRQWLERGEIVKDDVLLRPTPTATPMVSPTAGSVDPPEALVRLNDGGREITLDRRGSLSGIDHLPPHYRRMVESALTDQRLEKSKLLTGLTRPRKSRVRGRDQQKGEFSIIKPIGTVILTDRPAFLWTRLDGAASYIVEVYDEGFIRQATSLPLSENSWTPAKPLPRGKIYIWMVKAIKDGQEVTSPQPPGPEAKFRILDHALADELIRAQRNISSHLMLGLLYLQVGLLDEAELEFRKLRDANPKSAIALRLLAEVQGMRN
jgi:hypothetical protein